MTKFNKFSGNEERLSTTREREIGRQVEAHRRRIFEQNEARLIAEHGTSDPFEIFDRVFTG